MIKKIFKWIEEQKKAIIDPENEGITEEMAFDERLELGLEFDEGQQAQLQLLNELTDFLETIK